MTDLVRNYLADAFDNFNLGLDGKMRVQILSVFDIGNGIQKTLTKYEWENEIELVKKSFDDLVTSKVDESANEQPGFGLGDIVALSRELKALLYVQSGGVELFYDFSDESEEERSTLGRGISFISLDKRKKANGVSLSLIWVVQSDKTQKSLF